MIKGLLNFVPLPLLTNLVLGEDNQVSTLPPVLMRLSPLQEDSSIIDLHSSRPPVNLNPDADDFLPNNPLLNPDPQPPLPPPRFPNNSVRQRSSNVPVTDPENEFLKTALDACRSNIVQQQTELKKLKESNDLRNKRIMQLETQVGAAASFISDRGTGESTSSNTSSDSLSRLNDSLNLLMTKLALLTDQSSAHNQSVNVYNNACHLQKPEIVNKTTQTVESMDAYDKSGDKQNDFVEDVLKCTICNKTFETSTHLEDHIETAHSQLSLLSCCSCDARFSSTKQLEEHISQRHVPLSLPCPDCAMKFKNTLQLSDHVNTHHAQNAAASAQSETLPTDSSASSLAKSSTSSSSL